MRRLSWQTLPVLPCWASSEVARCCEASFLSCGDWWHEEDSERGGEARGPLYPATSTEHDPDLPSSRLPGAAVAGRERTSCGAALEFPASVCGFCVSCMRAHECECIHSDFECVHVLSGRLCFLMTRLSQQSAFRRTSCDHLTAVQHSSRHTHTHTHTETIRHVDAF